MNIVFEAIARLEKRIAALEGNPQKRECGCLTRPACKHTQPSRDHSQCCAPCKDPHCKWPHESCRRDEVEEKIRSLASLFPGQPNWIKELRELVRMAREIK